MFVERNLILGYGVILAFVVRDFIVQQMGFSNIIYFSFLFMLLASCPLVFHHYNYFIR
jgi:hypothetical protein